MLGELWYWPGGWQGGQYGDGGYCRGGLLDCMGLWYAGYCGCCWQGLYCAQGLQELQGLQAGGGEGGGGEGLECISILKASKSSFYSMVPLPSWSMDLIASADCCRVMVTLRPRVRNKSLKKQVSSSTSSPPDLSVSYFSNIVCMQTRRIQSLMLPLPNMSGAMPRLKIQQKLAQWRKNLESFKIYDWPDETSP